MKSLRMLIIAVTILGMVASVAMSYRRGGALRGALGGAMVGGLSDGKKGAKRGAAIGAVVGGVRQMNYNAHYRDQMRRQQYCEVLFLVQLDENVTKLFGGFRVQTKGRLVKESNFGILNQHFRYSQTLFHSPRKGSDL